MRRSPRFLSAVVLALVFFAVPAQAQTLPASLQGEFFFAQEFSSLPTENTGSVDVSGECTPTVGETFTLTYQAEGPAYGPYPGTFRESGTVTATLTEEIFPGIVGGVVVTWTAEFSIDSPVGDVTGTKTLMQELPEPSAYVCYGAPAAYDRAAASADLSYEAMIRPESGGTFTDEGESYAQVQSLTCRPESSFCHDRDNFGEEFYTSTGVLPVDTSGKATGGGQVVSGSNPLERVTFGFNVRKDEDGDRLKGTCNVVDHATGTHVKCLNVTDYQQVGNTATWEGTAKVNGVREHYRITVQDNGEPNQGIDTFSIKTESYEAAGNVANGNVQLHKQELVNTTL